MKTKTKGSTTTKAKPAKKQQQKKIIVAAIAVSAAGILGYFGWQYWKKRKSNNQAVDLDEALKTVSTSSTTSIPEPYIPTTSKPNKTSGSKTGNTSPSTSAFPLKKGSKGEKVKQLQEALIDKYGRSILPKYGADGDFGTETVNALKKAGLPATVNESTFNVLVQGTSAQPTDATALGKELFAATKAKDFNKAIAVLKKMDSTDDYAAANEVFKSVPLGAVRQTIVNGLLNTFSQAGQKEKIRFEFLRMGLQYDGEKWSLSGLDGLPIMTVMPATIWINAVKGVKVPARMVLGNEICKRLDYTLFSNKGKYFLVQSKCVKPLKDCK